MDGIYAGDGFDIIHYSYDDSWQSGDAAHNTGSFGSTIVYAQEVSLAGRYQSYDGFDGGNGYDVLQMSDGSEALFLANSSVFNGFGHGTARIRNIEEIRAGGGDDVIDMSDNTISYGNVTVYGEDGNDVIWTSDGDDVLDGGAGSDILYGGVGVDQYTGGTGSDTFDFSHLLSSTSAQRDVITDFEQGIDKIDLSRTTSTVEYIWETMVIPNTGLTSADYDHLLIDEFSDLSITYEGGSTIISSVSDDNDFEIELLGTYTITDDDFNW